MRVQFLAALILLAGCLQGPNEREDDAGQDPGESASAAAPWFQRGDGASATAADFPAEPPRFRLEVFPAVWAWEPTIGAAPDGTLYAAASINVSLDGSPTGGSHEVLVLRGLDEGVHWSQHEPSVSGVRPPNPGASDPFLSVDAVTGRVFAYKIRPECGTLAWSADRAETWTVNPMACGNPVEDRPILASGPTSLPTLDPAFPRVLYLCSNQVATSTCKRTLDGGLTFQQGVPPFGQDDDCSVAAGNMQTTIAVSEVTGTAFVARVACGLVQVARSTDSGTTWQVSAFPDRRPASCRRDTPTATDHAGAVYVAWLGEGCLPRIAASRDDGVTWGPALNASRAGLRAASHLALAAGGEGRVALSYLGTEQTLDASSRKWSLYVAVTHGAHEPAPVFAIVDAAGRPLVAGPDAGGAGTGQGLHGVGDFLGLVVTSSGRIAAVAADVCAGPCPDPAGEAGLGHAVVAVQDGGTQLA